MAATRTILVAGATGDMGERIVRLLSQYPDVQVRALVRQLGTGRSTTAKLQQLLSLPNVALAEGDLLQPASLARACAGVDTVVSAVAANGDPSIERDGQLNLLAAAQQSGVRRFLPSDFAADYFKLDRGDVYSYDARIDVAKAVQQSGLDHSFVLVGAFMDVFFAPFLQVFSLPGRVVRYWGDGTEPFDLTTRQDAARYAVEEIVAPRAGNGKVSVAGDVVNIQQLVAAYEEVKGVRLEQQQLGSIDELRAWIERTKATAVNPWEYLPAQYLYVMLSGKGKLAPLMNYLYPAVQPTSVRQFIATEL